MSDNRCNETCISKILEFILELQKCADNTNLDSTGCDKPCLGPNLTNGLIFNTRPITLYSCCTGNLWSMPFTLNGVEGESTVFKIFVNLIIIFIIKWTTSQCGFHICLSSHFILY